jgi:hypothetical protein
MTQCIPDRFERGALAQQSNRQRMAQAMGPLGRNIQMTAANPMIKDVVHARGA